MAELSDLHIGDFVYDNDNPAMIGYIVGLSYIPWSGTVLIVKWPEIDEAILALVKEEFPKCSWLQLGYPESKVHPSRLIKISK